MVGNQRGNRRLKQARRDANLTQEQSAEALSTLGEEMFKVGALGRRLSVSPRQYRRWESENPPWPHADHRKLLERFYGQPVTELGFTSPGSGGPVLIVLRTEDENPAPVNRRQVLTAGAAVLGGAAAGQHLPWMSPASAPGQPGLRVGADEVAHLQAAADDLYAIDQRFGGDRLWRSARAQLLWLHHLIDQGLYSEGTGQDLHAIAGQLTTSLGWYCYDADQQTDARVYFSEALNTAMLTGDDALATRTLSNMSRQSVDLGKGREAVRFARIAQAHATEWSAPPRVGALLAIREAHGHATLGDEFSTNTAVKRAWNHFERGTSQRDPDWAGFLNEAELTCLEGMCRLDLGQHQRAVTLLGHSATLQDIDHSRNRGMCLARLAHGALGGGDLDRTIAAAEESLRLVEGGMSSARNMKQLVLVGEGLARHRTHAPARDMAEQLAQYA